MQYSLIPVPFSLYGESYLAGKTENCMAHPDCRGKGLYYIHEKKYFETAKNRFSIFFTTTGNVAQGAPGAVRRKLGYTPFDSWRTLYFFVDQTAVNTNITKKARSKKWKLMLSISKPFLSFYFFIFSPTHAKTGSAIVKEENAPLNDIEHLWEKNMKFHGVTVYRSKNYLDWRINKNPYVKHNYLLYRIDGALKGYIIFYKENDRTVRIVDAFAERKDSKILRRMIRELQVWAKENQLEKISCITNKGNRALIWAFYSLGFLSFNHFSRIKTVINKDNLSQKKPFHVYISNSVYKKHSGLHKARNWYMTELVFEGRKN